MTRRAVLGALAIPTGGATALLGCSGEVPGGAAAARVAHLLLGGGGIVPAVQRAGLRHALSLAAGHRPSLRTYPDPRPAARARRPLVAPSLVFTLAGLVLLAQPMAMRHGT